MKVFLCSLNAKYIHSSLAIRSLKAYCKDLADIIVCDYSINADLHNIVTDIYTHRPDVAAFSCYIWNIEETIKIIGDLKKLLPETKIILGGPEVSFNPEYYLHKYNEIDVVISGEGEKPFREYLLSFKNEKAFFDIDGLSFKHDGEILINTVKSHAELKDIPFAYEIDDLHKLMNKIVYYESTRGCPFSCTYCLSSTDCGVRFLTYERVQDDLKRFINAGVKQVKFVDRTFNINKKHALEIWKMILEFEKCTTNFHFEISADLLDLEMIDFLKKVPEGLFQFEIGVQSTNEETLRLVERKTDLSKLFHNVRKLHEAENIHLHLDLIAGLPCENLVSFEKSFNEVYDLHPHHLQLGFLKVLKGTKISRQRNEFGIIARDYPPYEVLKTAVLSYDDILLLKDIENILEIYHNSHHFDFFLKYIMKKWKEGAFSFYRDFAFFIKNFFSFNLDYLTRCKTLVDFANSLWPQDEYIQKEIMILDILSNQKRFNLPSHYQLNEIQIKDLTNKIIKEGILYRFSEDYDNIDVRVLQKNILAFPCSVETANFIFDSEEAGIVIFDYFKKNKITNRFKTFFVSRFN